LIDGVIDRIPDNLEFRKKLPFDRELLNKQMLKWVDKALELDAKNIKRMERLISRQRSLKMKVLARALRPLKTIRNLTKDATWERVNPFMKTNMKVISSS